MYDVWIYATTKLLAEIPIVSFVPLIFNLCVYFAVGLTNSFTQWIAFYCILFMMIEAAMALGYSLSAFFNHEATALAFAPIVNMPLNLLSGYMINLAGIMHQIPQAFLAWLQYVSPQNYGFSALMNVQFPVECTADTVDQAKAEASGMCIQVDDDGNTLEDGEGGNRPYYYKYTVEVLLHYGLWNRSYWGCIFSLLVVFLVFRAIVILVLFCQDKQRAKVTGDTRNTNIVLPQHLKKVDRD